MLSDFLYRNKTGVSLVFCLTFSIVSMAWKGNGVSRLLVGVKNLGTGVSSAFTGLGQSVRGLWNSLEDYQNVLERAEALQKQLKQNDTLLADYKKLQSENQRLREELDFKPRVDYPTVRSEVLAVRLASIYKTIIIDKGGDHGIKPFMPVVGKTLVSGLDPKTGENRKYIVEALVGKVISVDSGNSVIQPLINHEFRAGVRMPGTRLWATLDGNSERPLQPVLRYISSFVTLNSDKARLPVVTSGKGGIFPPGILVGRIARDSLGKGAKVDLGHTGFKTAYIEPFIDIAALDTVVVILKKPHAWARKWPASKEVKAGQPEMGKLVVPDFSASELPGTSQYLQYLPGVLAEQKEMLQKKAEEKKKKWLAKQKAKKKSQPKQNQPGDSGQEPDEFTDVYLDEGPATNPGGPGGQPEPGTVGNPGGSPNPGGTANPGGASPDSGNQKKPGGAPGVNNNPPGGNQVTPPGNEKKTATPKPSTGKSPSPPPAKKEKPAANNNPAPDGGGP